MEKKPVSERREHTEFINHLMGCGGCFAPSDRYCAKGREYWIDDKVGYVFSFSSRDERNEAVRMIRAIAPDWAEVIEKRIRERKAEMVNGSSK